MPIIFNIDFTDLMIYVWSKYISSLKLTADPWKWGPLEKEIPNLETTIFRGELLVLGRVNEIYLAKL